jgi:hypothetical protein
VSSVWIWMLRIVMTSISASMCLGCPLLALDPCTTSCAAEVKDGLPPPPGSPVTVEIISSTRDVLVLDTWGLRFSVEFPPGSSDSESTFHPATGTRALIHRWEQAPEDGTAAPRELTAEVDVSINEGPFLVVRSIANNPPGLKLQEDETSEERCHLEDGRIARIAALVVDTDDGSMMIRAGERLAGVLQGTSMTLAAQCPVFWDCADDESPNASGLCGEGQLIARRQVE